MNTAYVDWALDVTCPSCDQNNNLADDCHDPEGEIAKHIFNNEWDDLNGHTVVCKWCGHVFKLDKVEY